MLSAIAGFAVIALVVVLMPGADTILVLRTSLRDGARAGIITASGIVCGPVIWGALAGLGAALVLSQDPLLYSAVAAAGGLYLAYLAYRTFLSARSTWRSAVTVIPDATATAPSSRRSMTYFFTGLMTNLLNPKIGAFYLSVMPGLFIGQQITAWLGALLGAIHAVLGLAFLSGVAALSGLARKYLTQPRVQAVIEMICGLCLLGFGALVVVEAVIHSGLIGCAVPCATDGRPRLPGGRPR
ncbi:MAG: LysE family translocator [Microbacterium sp.]